MPDATPSIQFITKEDLPKRTISRPVSEEQQVVNDLIESIKKELVKVKGDKAVSLVVPAEFSMSNAQSARNKARRLVKTALETHEVENVNVKSDAEVTEKDGQFIVKDYTVYLYAG